jgi:hypothetical protein
MFFAEKRLCGSWNLTAIQSKSVDLNSHGNRIEVLRLASIKPAKSEFLNVLYDLSHEVRIILQMTNVPSRKAFCYINF